jgi:hypothetical protein
MNDKRTIIPSWFKSAETPADVELKPNQVGIDTSVMNETLRPMLDTLNEAEVNINDAPVRTLDEAA